MTGYPIQHVATGSFVVEKKKPKIIEAFLGTCVGVVLYDKESGVGGLLHILLPRPVSDDFPENPLKYASTGIPIFLDAIIAKGAAIDNLKAWVAGGALVEPITRHDMNLDIGGRTAEIAKNLLMEKNIPIENSETGGFFTCSLSINIQNFECVIKPAGMDKSIARPGKETPTEKKIDKIINKLQPIPQVALKVLRLITDNAYDFKKIAAEVKKDQVITAKTIQLCNSAFFAGTSKIDSLEDALIILGQNMLVKSILRVAVNNYFNQSGMGYALCKGGLFHHAMGTGILAEKLAEATGKSIPAVAYTAGLVHDIGMVVLDRFVGSSFPMFYRNAQEKRRNIISIEKEMFGMDHTMAGARLARLWNFSKSLEEAIAFHHSPEKAMSDTDLSHIIFLAEFLMSRFHGGLGLERVSGENLEPRLAVLGLSIDNLPEIIDLIPTEVFGERPNN